MEQDDYLQKILGLEDSFIEEWRVARKKGDYKDLDSFIEQKMAPIKKRAEMESKDNCNRYFILFFVVTSVFVILGVGVLFVDPQDLLNILLSVLSVSALSFTPYYLKYRNEREKILDEDFEYQFWRKKLARYKDG